MPCAHCQHCQMADNRARHEAILAIRDCPDCDDYGRRDDLSACPLHMSWTDAQSIIGTDTRGAFVVAEQIPGRQT